ncbi:Mn-dependent DtxR family transcriptional regulator [Clostridium beijerinckii]|nr:Mn-dependent DtxR family transcriptional regulator [Clostridium beijerinckii]NRU44795.1 Mn-dependent DtxR family transcriptional regulator [Clostridium beijerinckii]NRU56256.1 Mn-dependent DtxR family transcriptional regulator [Clostridium beijerinckii]NRV03642.1 Mn-dependent DtxR family transcriptional regulator [Clostridium beijerinckii]NRV25376.1 Mn-dependent DtxR family transcriptional regulator [Clostridium beijerinckii]
MKGRNVMMEDEFFTFREYMKKNKSLLSPSAEDYMEMIYRLSNKTGFIRVNDLAAALNVQPSSVTKMIQKLANLNLIKYEKYGVIILRSRGVKIGKYLLKRHDLIEEFLKLLNISDDILEETEKIEHTISTNVLYGMIDLINFFNKYPDLMEKFNRYRDVKNKS